MWFGSHYYQTIFNSDLIATIGTGNGTTATGKNVWMTLTNGQSITILENATQDDANAMIQKIQSLLGFVEYLDAPSS